MKQKDIALILVIIIASGALSFFVSRLLFNSPNARQVKYEVVDKISTEFTIPSEKYFNANAINPTLPITIGDGSNGTPFASE